LGASTAKFSATLPWTAAKPQCSSSQRAEHPTLAATPARRRSATLAIHLPPNSQAGRSCSSPGHQGHDLCDHWSPRNRSPFCRDRTWKTPWPFTCRTRVKQPKQLALQDAVRARPGWPASTQCVEPLELKRPRRRRGHDLSTPTHPNLEAADPIQKWASTAKTSDPKISTCTAAQHNRPRNQTPKNSED